MADLPSRLLRGLLVLTCAVCGLQTLRPQVATAQVPPNAAEVAGYSGLHAASAIGAVNSIGQMIANGPDADVRDGNGRTPFHVAVFLRQRGAMEAPAAGRAEVNALDNQRYDAVTIAAVADDPEPMSAAIRAGNRAGNITSIHDGRAMIAVAHLGHDEVVLRPIVAGAPPTMSTIRAGRR